MILLIWVILMCVGLGPILSFILALAMTVILILMEEEEKPQVVNNYFIGGYDDDTN